MIAEILHAIAAEPAISVNPAHPGDADARPDRQIRGCAFYHLADDLMTRDDARLYRREVTFDDVAVGAADPAGNDLQ